MPIKETDIAWLAGIVDGEGSIMLNRLGDKMWPKSGSHLCRVSISNTDEGILNEVKRILSEWLIFYTVAVNDYQKRNKPCCQIEVNRRMEAKFLLEQILPYLKETAKIEKAKQFIEFVKTYKPRPRGKGCKKKELQYSYL